MTLGMLLRNQVVDFILEGTTSNSKSSVVNFQKNSKFSSELMFTCKPLGEPEQGCNAGSLIQGRLPKHHCEFLVPLLKHNYIHLHGLVCYDVGDIQTFDQVPIVLYVLVNNDFLNVNLTLDSSTAYKFKQAQHGSGMQNSKCLESVNGLIEARLQNKLQILEACNSLLIWLQMVICYILYFYEFCYSYTM